MTRHPHQIAAVLAFAAFLAFSVSDAFSRHLIEAGHNLFFVTGMFQGLALIILLLGERKLGGVASLPSSPNKKLQILRGVLFCISMPLNMYAFSVLPFALVYSLLFTGSFWAILFSRAVTGEHIAPRQMIAVVLGMIGALIVLRPWNAGFDPLMIIPLVSTALYGLRTLIERRIGQQETPLAMATYPILIGIPVMMCVGFSQSAFLLPTLPDFGLIVLGGLLAGIGMVCLPVAFRYAPITTVGPFHYTQLIWGSLIGFFFFNQHPDIWTLVGGAIIVAGGLAALFRR